MLAIPSGIAALFALQPIPIRGARICGDLFSVSLGHNPAGAVMILFLILAVLGISVTGWMMTTDAFWGSAWVEAWHTGLVDITLWAVAIHVAANLYESVKHRENLVWAMVTGHKQNKTIEPVVHRQNDGRS